MRSFRQKRVAARSIRSGLYMVSTYPSFNLLAVLSVLILLIYPCHGQGVVSGNPDGPFAEALERRRAERDLRSLPLKLRERRERNFSDPRIVKQMNEDFLQIQALRQLMVSAFGDGSRIAPERLIDYSGEIGRRASRLRSNLALTEEEVRIVLDSDSDPSLASINKRAYELCLEISRFTGNPLFKRKAVININQAKEASVALDKIIVLADALESEASRVKKAALRS